MDENLDSRLANLHGDTSWRARRTDGNRGMSAEHSALLLAD